VSSTATSGHTARLSISSTGIQYPSPFFDIASQYLPSSQKQLMGWCKYYSVYDDIASSTVRRLAAFPVTRIVFEVADKDERERYRRLFEDRLGLKAFSVEIGLDYYTYGNAFVSVLYPFRRYLVCSKCSHSQHIQRAKYKWKQMQFVGECPKCQVGEVAFQVQDRHIPMESGIKLQRWDPANIDIQAAEESCEARYYYTLPGHTRAAILRGERFFLETVPKAFLDAAKLGVPIRLNPRHIYHFKRPGRSDSTNSGWGISVLAGVLKKLFYKQIILKAQEQLAHQHIVPMWVFAPEANADLNPFSDLNLSHWKSRLQGEIRKWRRDPNYIMISPIPIKFQQIGGDQAGANIHQQLEAVNLDIIAGMNVPKELVFGGLSYASASVTVRLTENDFASYQHELNRVIEHFIVRNICRYLGMKPPRTRMQSLKMADDVQQKTAMQQLFDRGIISKRLLCETFDIDYDDDADSREKERVETGEATIKDMEAQARAQAAYQETAQRYTMRMQLRMKKLEQEIMDELAQQGMDMQALQMESQQIADTGGYPQAGFGPEAGMQQPVDPAADPSAGAAGGGGATGGAGGAGSEDLMRSFAQTIMSMPGDQQLQQIQALEATSPEIAEALRQAMSQMGGAGGGQSSSGKPGAGQVDMRPLPKVLPQRRAQPA